jgi:hypothetical protein
MTRTGRSLARASRVAVLFAGVIAAVPGTSVAGSDAGAASLVTPRCATFVVKGASYGVYVAKGQVACTTAKNVLQGIGEGKGKYVDNGASANSYTVYDGWICPSGQMGIQTCEQATKPTDHPKRQIFSLACSHTTGEPACPKRDTGETP